MCYLKKFNQIVDDLSIIGLMRDCLVREFCTPINCTIFARLGVDGVHFCYLNSEEDNSPIFLVNPMAGEKYVVPVANNLLEFLSLVVKTRDAGELEYIYLRSRDENMKVLTPGPGFEDDESELAEKELVCQKLKDIFPLFEITDCCEYIKTHIADNLLNEIEFSDEYYEFID